MLLEGSDLRAFGQAWLMCGMELFSRIGRHELGVFEFRLRD